MPGNLESRRDGRVLIVVDTDPATRNALSWELYDSIRDCVDAAGCDPAVGAIVLTGASGFFSSGGNVNGLRERATLDLAGQRASVEMLHAMTHAMRACPKPIIAAGDRRGGGARRHRGLSGKTPVGVPSRLTGHGKEPLDERR